MKYVQVILWSLLFLMSCQTTSTPTQKSVKKIILTQLDLYPKHPECPDYFEKKDQLNCLKHKIHDYISQQLQGFSDKELTEIKDSTWLYFLIDTLGITHLTNIKPVQTNLKNNGIVQKFEQIALKIPRMKPAIYHDKPVNFEFKIPLFIQSTKKANND